MGEGDGGTVEAESKGASRTYSRFVVFAAGNQEYGVPVDQAQEITFLDEIDDMFKSGCVEGALQLRGQTIPVLQAGALLNSDPSANRVTEECRILVLRSEMLTFGMIVGEVREIMTVVDDQIMPMVHRTDLSVSGIYSAAEGRNIMLLDVVSLIGNQVEKLKSMARLRREKEEEKAAVVATSRHLITENCYLVFTIDRNFAIEIKDVQEIIERDQVMAIPAAEGFDREIINLRGQVVPVINLRRFYGYPEKSGDSDSNRLIICKDGNRMIALEVDNILTIYKQEQYHTTPSLNPQLSSRKDTLDRLIEFIGEEGVKEHVLVVNMHNLVRNHLQKEEAISYLEDEREPVDNIEDPAQPAS
jgi:purine-binding chemotaxis protein CheW